jgi:hypothetical protein
MRPHKKRRRWAFRTLVVSWLVLCLVVRGGTSSAITGIEVSDGDGGIEVYPPLTDDTLGASPAQAELLSLQTASVDIAVVPSSRTVQVNETFTLDIYVYPNGQQVDAVDADLTFDPTYLEVLSVTGDSSGLDIELYNAFNNSAGTLTHSRGKLTGTPPSSTFRLCSISLKAKAATGGTTLASPTPILRVLRFWAAQPTAR